jgi:segregation and condensation protein A
MTTDPPPSSWRSDEPREAVVTPDVQLAPGAEVAGLVAGQPGEGGAAVEAAVQDSEAPAVDAELSEAGPKAFAVRVGGFEGPFDLLLSLIARHRIEVTELALHVVTDDFIAHVRAQGAEWDLDEATSFLVIAATLLDLKAARLLPDGSVEDEEDLALLEARDLLFARLLQYRAFKEVAALLDGMLTDAATRRPRDAALEPWLAELLPEVLLGLGPVEFAAIAEAAFEPRPPDPGVSTTHIHAPAVSVREQAAILVERLRRRGVSTFRALTDDAPNTLVVVGRFLALLELYRDGVVTFEQAAALGELSVRWVGPDDEADAAAIAERAVTDEFRGVVEATDARSEEEQ